MSVEACASRPTGPAAADASAPILNLSCRRSWKPLSFVATNTRSVPCPPTWNPGSGAVRFPQVKKLAKCRDRVALYGVVLGVVFTLVATGGWAATSKYRTWGSAGVLRDLSPMGSCNSCGGNPTSPNAFLSNLTCGISRAIESVNPIYTPYFPLGNQFRYALGQWALPSASERSPAKSPASLSSGLWQIAIGVGMVESALPIDTFCFSESRRAPASFLSLTRSSEAASASILACADALAASIADCFASPASSVTSASNWSLLLLKSPFFVRNWPLICAITIPNANSPKMPNTTRDVAPIPSHSFRLDGRSGGRTIPRRHASDSSLCSHTINQISAATPMTTQIVKNGSSLSQNADQRSREFIELSNAEIELFKADTELSKAEESEGRLEAAWVKSVAITAIALLLLLAARIGKLIVARRRDYHSQERYM